MATVVCPYERRRRSLRRGFFFFSSLTLFSCSFHLFSFFLSDNSSFTLAGKPAEGMFFSLSFASMEKGDKRLTERQIERNQPWRPMTRDSENRNEANDCRVSIPLVSRKMDISPSQCLLIMIFFLSLVFSFFLPFSSLLTLPPSPP